MSSCYKRFRCSEVPCPQSPIHYPNPNHECDCCCVPGIKNALEKLKNANAVIVVDSPFFNSLIAGHVIDVTCDILLLGPPIGNVSTPITGSTPGQIAKETAISLCAITFVAAG